MTAAAQIAAAGARSNEVRRQASTVMRLVRAGRLGVLDVLDGTVPPHLRDGAGSIALERLVRAAPQVGVALAARIVDTAEANAIARIRDLPPGRRRRVGDAFLAHAPARAHVRLPAQGACR